MAVRNTVCIWVERDMNDMPIAYHLDVASVDDVAQTFSLISQFSYPDTVTWLNAMNTLLPH